MYLSIKILFCDGVKKSLFSGKVKVWKRGRLPAVKYLEVRRIQLQILLLFYWSQIINQ